MVISALGFALVNLTVKFLDRIPATELVLFRSIISLSISYYFLKRRKIPVLGNSRFYLVLRGVFGVSALSMFFITLQKLPLASAITIQYLSPIFTALFGIFMLKEKVKHWQWLFFLISFAGIAVIKGFDSNITPGLFILGIASAICSGMAYNFIRLVKNTDHPLVVVFYFPLVATPVMAIISLFNWVTPVGIEWLLLVLMGVLTQIAQINMTKGLQSAEINEVASIKYVGIIFAISFDLWIFGVSYKLSSLIGILLVLTGVILNLRYKSKQRKLNQAN